MRRFCGLLALVALVTSCSGDGSSKGARTRATATNSHATATVARHRARETTSTRATPTTIRVVSGATGPTGSPGPPGPPGAPGPPGVSGFEIVRSAKTRVFDFNATDDVPLLEHSVSCPPGKTVISGGAAVTVVPPNGDSSVAAYIQRSEPLDASTWVAAARFDHYSGSLVVNLQLTVTAACAFVG